MEGEVEEIKKLPPRFIEFPFLYLFILFSNFDSYNYGDITFLSICLIYFLFMLSSITFKRNINDYINFDTIYLATYFYLVCMLDTFFSGFTIYFCF